MDPYGFDNKLNFNCENKITANWWDFAQNNREEKWF